MVALINTVECVICHVTHLETPRVRENNEYDAKDWTYYRDSYLDLGYSVICKRVHDNLIAPKPAKLES